MQNRPGQPRARISNEAARPNSLGLHQRELADLLDQFDGFEAPPKNVKRDFVRWPFRRSAVPVKITHPNGISAEISVACRNISRGGMAFLHRGYLHTGTRCTVRLPHPEAGELVVDGWVARCQHRAGLVHEIGVAFSEEIDVRDLLRPDPLSDCFTLEKVDVENLEGAVLHVDPSEADQKIVRHFLRSTRIRVATAFTPTDAQPHLGGAWDVIIADTNLPEGGGAKFVRALREKGHSGAIIVTTSDTSPAGRRNIEQIEADAFLSKPLAQSVLIRAVAEFILGGRDASRPSVGTLTPDHPDYQSAVGFALTLRHAAKKLEDTVRREDAATCRTLCQQLAASAPPLGFSALGKLAGDSAAILTRTMSISASIKPIRALISACERARVRKAA
jgi:DNA-binding NarL/FixJ family response regulator